MLQISQPFSDGQGISGSLTPATEPTTLFFLLDLREPSKWIPSLGAKSEAAVYLIGFVSCIQASTVGISIF